VLIDKDCSSISVNKDTESSSETYITNSESTSPYTTVTISTVQDLKSHKTYTTAMERSYSDEGFTMIL